MPKQSMVRDNFPEFYWEVADPKEMQGMFFGFLDLSPDPDAWRRTA